MTGAWKVHVGTRQRRAATLLRALALSRGNCVASPTERHVAQRGPILHGVNRIIVARLPCRPARSKTQTGRLRATSSSPLSAPSPPRFIKRYTSAAFDLRAQGTRRPAAGRNSPARSSRRRNTRPWPRSPASAPVMVFLLAAALSRRSKLIGIELCRWTLMEINHNQITDRLRRNSGARELPA